MFILDKPYVSEFLVQTIITHRIPLLKTPILEELSLDPAVQVFESAEAADYVRENPDTRLYTNSENAIGWISEHLDFTDLPEKTALFKDKVRFRELLKPIFPDFYFRAAALEDIKRIEPSEIPFPVVVKPAVGFFSMGVHIVQDEAEWGKAIHSLDEELQQVQGLYPQEVMDGSMFIIEECLEGDEYAVDAYFDGSGEAVVVNIHQHIFSSGEDVSDRVYLSSSRIIQENLEEFTAFLNELGKLAQLRNFPVHMELRRQVSGALIPIEVNPMRFGGWCSTPDASWFAYGLNPYTAYLHAEKPDWKAILEAKEDHVYGLVVLDNSTGLDTGRITYFNYEGVERAFSHVTKLRRIDFRAYPVFGFVFTETPADDLSELQRILSSDLREFVQHV